MFDKSKKNNCPNPKCNCKIIQPIIIHDLSVKSKKKYYGCSKCFFEVKKISSQFQKRELKTNPIKREEETPSSCLNYYGYLSSPLKDINISQECLVCPKLGECTRN